MSLFSAKTVMRGSNLVKQSTPIWSTPRPTPCWSRTLTSFTLSRHQEKGSPRVSRNYSSAAASSSSSSSASLPNDTQMRMLIVGCPGSGKGTQSSRLLKHYNLTVISSGDVLRSHIQQGTEIGLKAQKVIKAGELMPDEIMTDLIGSEVEKLADRHWLLDGFPRTLGQAQMLDKMLKQKGKQLELVINLDVPQEVILDRILQRWTHLASGRIYNLSFNPPKVAGKDDITGEPLVKREDDNPETFSKRLALFHRQTEPMLEHYCQTSASTGILDIDTKATPVSTSTANGKQLYINLRGDTSDQIWPHLKVIVDQRFPTLPKLDPQ